MNKTFFDKLLRNILSLWGIMLIFFGLAVYFELPWVHSFVPLMEDEHILAEMLGIGEMAIGIIVFFSSFHVVKNWVVNVGNLLFCLYYFYYFAFVLPPHPVFIILSLFLVSLILLLCRAIFLRYRMSYDLDQEIIEAYRQPLDEVLAIHETNSGESLLELSMEKPMLLVFLRHFGCTFCRETLRDLSKLEQEVEGRNTTLVLVHMMPSEVADVELRKFGLEHIPHVSDPEQLMYKQFSLRRGTLRQLLGIDVIIRGLKVGIKDKLGIGKEMGDSFQMPGVFLVYNGKIVKKYVHKTAADVPPYQELLLCEECV